MAIDTNRAALIKKVINCPFLKIVGKFLSS
jgi:hypothetical protein